MAKRIITVSRQFGSGGRTIAKRVAEEMGYAYYDNELVTKIAKESGLAEEYIRENSETAATANRFLFNLTAGLGREGMPMNVTDKLYILQHNIIRELAEKECCVIVGRCADYILRDRTDALHTYFYADIPHRAERIVKLYGEREDNPEKRLREQDEKRALYYKFYTQRPWGMAENYHICLDTGLMGLDRCVSIVLDAARS